LKASFSWRIGFLLLLLVAEVALVVSLRALGWYATNGGLIWASCLICAVLPFVAAVVALLRNRMRFDLRSMLVATALIAVFLYLSVRPLQTALSSRSASRSLLAAGAALRTKSSWDSVYAQLKYDPRTTPEAVPLNQELAVWLRPLAGSLLKISPSDSVREVWLSSDEQVIDLCGNAGRFLNLERVAVSEGVTPAGTEILRQALPRFARLSGLQIVDVNVPKDWFQKLPGIHTLSIWAEGPRAIPQLSQQQLRDIAALPGLRILWIYKCAITDADAKTLASAKSLRRLILRKTAVTQAGEDALSAAMPDCVIHRE
jgi:hypothetical protein